jgi:hypothetical protein
MYLNIYLPTYDTTTYLPTYLRYNYLPTYLPTYDTTPYLSIYLSIYPSTHLSAPMAVFLPVCPYPKPSTIRLQMHTSSYMQTGMSVQQYSYVITEAADPSGRAV